MGVVVGLVLYFFFRLKSKAFSYRLGLVNPFHTPLVTLPTNFNVVPNKNQLKKDSSGWHKSLMKNFHDAETNGLPFQVFFL